MYLVQFHIYTNTKYENVCVFVGKNLGHFETNLDALWQRIFDPGNVLKQYFGKLKNL